MRKLFEKGSSSLLLMKIAFYTGCVTFRGMRMLTDKVVNGKPNSYSLRKSAARMVEEGYFDDMYLKTSDSGKSRVLVPTKKAMDRFRGQLFPNDITYLSLWKHWLGYKHSDDPEAETARVTRITRVVLSSEQLCFFYRVFRFQDDVILGDVKDGVLPKEKPPIGRLGPDEAAWYSSKEVKLGLSPELARRCNGRAQGYAVFGKNMFTCIAMQRKPILMWGRKEQETNEIIRSVLAPRNLRGRCDYLITGTNNDLIRLLVGSEDIEDISRRKYMFFIDTGLPDNFLRYYFVPYSREGCLITAMLMTEGVPELLRQLPASGEISAGNMEFLYDYKEGDEYVFSFLVPDLYKLKKFIRGISVFPDKKGHIYLYEYQREAVEKLTEKIPNIILTVFRVEDVVDAVRQVMQFD